MYVKVDNISISLFVLKGLANMDILFIEAFCRSHALFLSNVQEGT